MSAVANIVCAGVELPEALVAEEAQNHPAPSAREAREKAARALAVRALLIDRARSRGMQPRPERDAAGREETADEALIRQLLSEEIEVEAAGREDCEAFYAAYPQLFRSPALYRASHILCAPEDETGPAVEAAKNRAAAILDRLGAKPAAFEGLAREYSDCPSGRDGGTLGQLETGDLVPEIETALDALQPGDVTKEPVKSRFGWHVLRLDQRAEGSLLPFDYVEEQIRTRLDAKAWTLAALAYADALVREASADGVRVSLTPDGEVAAPAISLGALMAGSARLAPRMERWLGSSDPELAAQLAAAAGRHDMTAADFVQRAASEFVAAADDSKWATLISAAQNAEDPVLASLQVILRERLAPPRAAATTLIAAR